MVAKKVRTKQVDRAKYKNYLKKADEFFESMNTNYAKGLWNACASDAVHCAISVADALLVWMLQIRSTSDKHEDIIFLVSSIPHPSSEKQTKHLAALLGEKSDVEYSVKLFRKNQAESLVKHANRFYQWAKEILP